MPLPLFARFFLLDVIFCTDWVDVVVPATRHFSEYTFLIRLSTIVLFQALSKRIHYGKFVAEAKFQESPDDYMPAIIDQVCSLML
jgi:hypothetical protein